MTGLILSVGNLIFQGLKTRATLLIKLMMMCLGVFALTGCENEMTGVLNPKGIIAFEERILLVDTLALMLIVVIPVVIMSFAFVYKYRAKKNSEYKPNWSHSTFLEMIWWGIPCALVIVMGVMSWKATHRLDPYNKIEGHEVAMKIEVISLPWKWLFIYPDHDVASVNELVIPVGKQVQFFLTADNSAMGAFFVPQLGSQIYTMAGMRSQLHLMADEKGTYRGLNSQYNGDGFSDMHFPVHVVDDEEMQAFFSKAKAGEKELNIQAYEALRQPSTKDKVQYFTKVTPHLFQGVIDFYMGPHAHEHHHHEAKVEHMNHEER